MRKIRDSSSAALQRGVDLVRGGEVVADRLLQHQPRWSPSSSPAAFSPRQAGDEQVRRRRQVAHARAVGERRQRRRHRVGVVEVEREVADAAEQVLERVGIAVVARRRCVRAASRGIRRRRVRCGRSRPPGTSPAAGGRAAGAAATGTGSAATGRRSRRTAAGCRAWAARGISQGRGSESLLPWLAMMPEYQRALSFGVRSWRAVVDVHDAETLGVAERPFEVVQQRPHHVAADVEPGRDRVVDRGQVLAQVVDAQRIARCGRPRPWRGRRTPRRSR